MRERIELPDDIDLTRALPSIAGPQEVTFGFLNEFGGEPTPQDVMRLTGHPEWADLQEGDIVKVAVLGREPQDARVTRIAFDDHEPTYTFEWV